MRRLYKKALSFHPVEYAGWKSLEDYYDLLESNLHWIPTENEGRTAVYNHVTTFYFLLDQSPVKELQTPIIQCYNMGDYIQPEGGWSTFNQFFARNVKPGYRPIAAINDDHVIVSPADSTHAGHLDTPVP